MSDWTGMQSKVRITGALVLFLGVVSVIMAPLVGNIVFRSLWSVEPLSYIGALLAVLGLGVVSISYVAPAVMGRNKATADAVAQQHWSRVTQHYFDLFDHDLGRPIRRISGKERELRAVLKFSGAETDPNVQALLDEIEMQTPNFRLMMSNIQTLVQLEDPGSSVQTQPVEPSEVIRKIVDRYILVAEQSGKDISWWAEPSDFGLVNSDSSAIEHIVTNLVDNAVRFAASRIEVRLSKDDSRYYVEVWDDGQGIPSHYAKYIFDHGWTPEVARREEKSSSGLGLFIARTLAERCGGTLKLETATKPDPDHHTSFLLSLPLNAA